MSLVKRIGIAAGALGGVAGVAYGASRLLAGRLRSAPDGDAPRALDAPAYVDHRLDTHDRGTIYVVEHGNELDQPVVLSHGVTLSVRTWFHQLEELPKEGLRTIAFDHRGHGRSVAGMEGHSLENLGRDFKTVLEELDLHDAVLVGHSMGGVAVQSFVTQFPEIAAERVAGIVLLSTLAYTMLGSRSTRTKARLEKIMKRAPDAQWLWDSPNLGFLAARIGFGKDPRPSHVELVRSMMSECPAETRLAAPRVLVGLDLTHELPKVHLPTLVIGGTADVLTPPSEAKRMARLIPGARLELMRGGGHMLMLERTDELNRLIVDFAREVRARGRAGPDGRASGIMSASPGSEPASFAFVSFELVGVRVGHVTGAGTGVTVVLFPSGSVGSAEVRGGAPATREIDLLDPSRTVARVDAIVLVGRLRVRARHRGRRDALPRRARAGIRDRRWAGADRARRVHLRPHRPDRHAAGGRRGLPGRGRRGTGRPDRIGPGRRGRGRDGGQVARA